MTGAATSSVIVRWIVAMGIVSCLFVATQYDGDVRRVAALIGLVISVWWLGWTMRGAK